MPEVSLVVDKARRLYVELKKVTAERENLKRQIAKFKKRVVELSEQNETVRSQLSTSRGTEGHFRTSQDLLSTKLSGFESELAQLQKEYQTANSQLADSQMELDLLRKENESLRGRLFEAESGYKNSSSANEQLEEALNEMQDKFVVTSRSKDTASTELEEAARERDIFRVEINRLTGRLRSRTLRTLIIAWTAVAITCFAIWANYTLSNQAVSKKLTEAQTNVLSLGEEINGYLKNVSTQETALKEKNKDIRRLEESVAKLQTDIDGLNGTILALKKYKDGRIETLGENISALTTQNEESLKVLKNKKDAAIKALNNKIARRDKRIQALMRTRAIAIPPLIAALDHPLMTVRNGTAASLEKLTGKNYGTKQDKWNDWWLQNRLRWFGIEKQ